MKLQRMLIAAIGLLLALSFWTNAVAADPGWPQIETLAHSFPAYQISGRRMAVGDLDGDGRPEFIYTAYNFDTRLVVVLGARAGGSMGVKQTLIMPAPELVAALPAGTVGSERLYVVFRDGMVRAYGEWPLRELRSFRTPGEVWAAAIGDLDADGSTELVLGQSGGVGAYSLASGELLWEQPGIAGDDIVLAQLDEDPQLEIVMGGAYWLGLVLDGLTGAENGRAPEGFGHYVTAGRFETGGSLGIAGVMGNSIGVFLGGPVWVPDWLYFVPYGVSSFAAADLDGDGRDELLYGDQQHNAGVHAIDTVTRQERLVISGDTYRINSIGVGNAVMAGRPLVAFSTARRIRVVDPQTGSEKFQHTTRFGRYRTVALADLDGDGRLEQFAGAVRDDQMPNALIVADATTGTIQWESTAWGWAIHALVVSGISGASEIIAGGVDTFDRGLITVLDTHRHEPRLRISYVTEPTLNSRGVDALTIVDFNHDGIADIVAATTATSTFTAGAKLHVFSGDDGHLLAETAALGAEWEPARSLLLTEPSNQDPPQLVLTLGGSVRGFDSATLQSLWTLPVDSLATRYINGPAGERQFAILRSDRTLVFHDARTLEVLRTLPIGVDATAMLPLGGPTDPFLIATDDRLHLLDGSDGSIVASSEYLGTGLARGNQLAAVALAPGVWQVASGGDAGFFSHRVVLDETIFSNGFQ